MKHIAVAVTNDLTYDQRMIRTCTTLVEAGYQVTLIGRLLEKSADIIKQPFSQVRLKCNVNSGPLFYAEYNRRLLRFLSDLDYDMAVACDLDTILAVTRVSRSKKRPFIFDSHELFTEVPELEGRGIVKGVWARIGKMCVPHAAKCYTVGPAIAIELTKRYQREFEVVRNVPSLSSTPLNSFDERDQTIFYQGALNVGRGLEVLIDCMRDIEGYRLILAGEGDISQALRNQVKKQGLVDRVVFMGRVDPVELPLLTAKARIGINVLEAKSKSYYLSLANKFFDYIQAGTPSINMNFPEYQSILNQFQIGLTIPNLTRSELSNSILSLTQNSKLWTELSENCLEARDTFCWENERNVLLKIYAEAISS
jgi:glycosyltransferase involved in cell wall biosynthesis